MLRIANSRFIPILSSPLPLKVLRLCPNFKLTSRYSSSRKRFYEKVNIIYNDGKYEITMDNKKLKTPAKNLFYVENMPLALSVAAEWDAQKYKIELNSMHLTGLCNTVIDNPSNCTKEDMAQEIVKYLDSDTVLFFSEKEDELYDLQTTEWSPVIEWFCEKFLIDIQAVRDIGGPTIKPEVNDAIKKYLLSYDTWAINGFLFAIEALKSVILGIACRERRITVEQAVYLSRLEEEYQAKRWGRIAWAHCLSKHDLQARVAAGIFFVHVNSSSTLMKNKIAK